MPPMEEPKVNIQQIVEACVKQYRLNKQRRNKASDQEGPEGNLGAGAAERMGIPSENVQRFTRIVLLILSSQLQSRRKTKPEPEWDVRGSCIRQIVPFGYCRSDYCRRKSGCPHRYRGHVVLLQVGLVQPVEEPPGSFKANQHSSGRRRKCACGAQRHNW